ncbi:MAG: hypothetical protein NDI82_03075 [Anaeromyxobacteraceae bacterium]|nr:hypothetical protein [Anaeromyxobacteraceae bacterium]
MAKLSGGDPFLVRRRSMLLAALILAPFSLLDLLLPRGWVPAAAGAAWCAALLLGAALQRAGATPLRALGILLPTLGGVAAISVKVLATGGAASLFFPLYLALPLLVLALGPDLPALVGLTGLAATVAGAAIRHHDGRGAVEVLYWSTLSMGVVAMAVVGALLQGRQRRELESERARATAMEAAAGEALRRGELERYAEVGRLAAAISHELNSPLASASTNLRWLEGPGSDDPSERSAALSDALAALQRITEVLSRIRLVALASDADGAGAEAAPSLTPLGLPAVTAPRPGRAGPPS